MTLERTRRHKPGRVLTFTRIRAGLAMAWVLKTLVLVLVPNLSGAAPDLSRPPDSQALAALARSGTLAGFRNELGDALASGWVPAEPGRRGACSRESFARWVDLYQWLDLIESEEASVTKRWLSRHLTVGGTADGGRAPTPLQVTILQPGSPLVRRHDPIQHDVTEKLSADSSLLGQAMGGLVEPPFSSRNGPLIARLDPEFVVDTIQDPVFLKEWSECFSEDDFAPKVLENLQAILKAHRSDWREYVSLAIALSVVMDQPAPSFWPHHQVPVQNVPRMDLPPVDAFTQWVRASRSGKLRMDPRKLEVGELKFVVDAPLDPVELNAVRSSPALSRMDPAKAFETITYDKARVGKEVYTWPWGIYRLSKIYEHGGICVDQAYFAAITGKALGIPTILFAGQGKDGGHAWIGWLKGPQRWDLGVGRYAQQNYATGEGLDPQSWTPITDHDLDLLTRHMGSLEPQQAARRDLVIAWNFRRRGDAAGEGRALKSALAACPENPAIWDAREDWLVRTGSPVAEIKDHHEAAIRQFSRFRDLKAQHQEALARIALDAGEQNRADRISGQIISENRAGLGARRDLSAAAAGNLISSRMAAGNLKGAMEEFTRQLHLQGADGGGDFFYKVVAPFASELVKRTRRDLARSVLKQSAETLKPVKDSLVARDLRKLWMDAGEVKEVQSAPGGLVPR